MDYIVVTGVVGDVLFIRTFVDVCYPVSGTLATSLPQGPRFNPELGWRFMCASHVCRGFLLVPQFPLTSQSDVWWIATCKAALVMNECVCLCVSLVIYIKFILL